MDKDYLYRIEYEASIDDMFNNIDYFPKDKKRLYIGMFIIYMIIMIPFSIIGSLILSLLFKSSFIFSLIIYILVCIVTLLIRLDKIIYSTYKKNFNKRKNRYSITEFYDNYLIRYSDVKPYIVNYSDINNMIETTDGFYFISNKIFYSINKKYCDKKLIDFIRSKVNNIESIYKYSYNIRLLIFKHSANMTFYDKIRISFNRNNQYILEIDEIYNKLKEKNINKYFGFTSFQKKEWTLILNDIIQIYPQLELI